MPLLPIIVMPARDEEAVLEAACLSLGFGNADGPNTARLVVVDNVSRDGTRALAAAIAHASPSGSVDVVHEPEPGHVPARRAGMAAASRWAMTKGFRPNDVLILQADADTTYLPGYVESMAQLADQAGPGLLVEGCSLPPAGTEDPCRALRALEAVVDGAVEELVGANDPFDVIVDDKVAAFRLSDYLAWGGHVREYDGEGNEVLAETTRLYMRALRLGGRKVRAEAAGAITSQRRILEDPATAFATAGFPRPKKWVETWRAAYAGPRELAAFVPGNEGALREAIAMRTAHMRALFGLLPAYVRFLSQPESAGSGVYALTLAMAGLAGRDLDPGDAISRILSVAAGATPKQAS